MRNILYLLLSLAFVTASSGAMAATLISDGFESDAIAVPTGSLVNWDITGSVDVVGPTSFGYLCLDGSNCLDLDGSAPGRIDSMASFDFESGVTYTLSFDYNSNGTNNSMTFGISGGLFTDQLLDIDETTGSYFQYSQSFTALGTGLLYFDSDSPSGVGGIVLDNILLTSDGGVVNPIPLPAGLPLLLGAFGFLGLVSRRRSLVS